MTDSAYQISLNSLSHAGSTATFRFFASGAGWQGGADEFFGFDNITVETEGVIPEPSSYLFLGSGLAALAAVKCRRV